MSDFTDDVINGDFCELCGVWLGIGEGYPRTCADCKKENKKHDS